MGAKGWEVLSWMAEMADVLSDFGALEKGRDVEIFFVDDVRQHGVESRRRVPALPRVVRPSQPRPVPFVASPKAFLCRVPWRRVRQPWLSASSTASAARTRIPGGVCHPANIESTLLQNACPALLDSAGEPVPACCDAHQAGSFKSQFGKLVKLGLGRDSKCFRNLQNLVYHAFCSPQQSHFVAVFGNSAKGKREPSATDIVYAVERNFAEVVYASCKDVRTQIFGIKLLYYMCGKYGSSKCSPQRFLDFLGARPSEGGYSPLKIRYVIAEAPVKVNGKTLEPFKADVF
ncbi:NPC1-like intracellular cholesterol transporter 1 [Dermacentor andersoni]|uniref:NPC1-like intracellular cholesterol transporter 1 n=1 Tax=Dermacentor andersoni TaxID=34620 RepID=UPI002416DF6F|nr:NPC1-like intracellular cholesterol transporter 1 [Dermacentor andersoni]